MASEESSGPSEFNLEESMTMSILAGASRSARLASVVGLAMLMLGGNGINPAAAQTVDITDSTVYSVGDELQALADVSFVAPVDFEVASGVKIHCALQLTQGHSTYGPAPTSPGDWEETASDTVSTTCPVANIKSLTARVDIHDGGVIPHNGWDAYTAKATNAKALALLDFPATAEPGPDITYYYRGSVTSTSNTTTSLCQYVKVNLATHLTLQSVQHGSC
jgi:hypothetical protein